MKCEITSRITHNVLISKEIRYKSYKEICSGEPKKVNVGYNWYRWFDVENNTLKKTKRLREYNIFGVGATMMFDWEILLPFFSDQNIQPNWQNCNRRSCMPQVWGTECWIWWLTKIILDWEGWGRSYNWSRLRLLLCTWKSRNLRSGSVLFPILLVFQIYEKSFAYMESSETFWSTILDIDFYINNTGVTFLFPCGQNWNQIFWDQNIYGGNYPHSI